MFRPALRLMGLFLAGAPAIWGDTLWYNGDATRPEFDANSVADPTGDVWIYDDFIVPAGDGAWQVTAVFSNDIFNNNNGPIPTQARWEIRTNISRGVPGNLVAGGIAPAVVNPTGRVFFGMIEYTVLVNVSVTLFPGTYWLSVAPVDPGVANQIAIFASISSTSGANCVGNPCGNDGLAFDYVERYPNYDFSPTRGTSSLDYSLGVLGSKIPNPSDAPILGVTYPPNWSVVFATHVNFTGWAINNPTSSHYSPIASVQVFRDGSFLGNAGYGEDDDCADHYSPACPLDGFELDDPAVSGGLHTYRAVATDSDPSPDSGYLDATYVVSGTSGSNDNGHPGVIWQNPVGVPLYISPGASQTWFLGGAQGTMVIGGLDLNPSPNSWRIAGIADFDGDGHPDVVWQDPASGGAQVWFLSGARGATYTGAAAALSGASTWRIAAVADFDGDGHPDLVWQNPATGDSQVWFMTGAQSATISGSAALSGPNTWQIVGAADFDGNGHADLVWQDPATGASQVWLMGGAQGTTIIGSAPLSGPNAWRIGRVMDFNGDGHPDLVWQEPVTGMSQAWLFGGAQGTTLTGAVALTGPTPLRIGR